MNRNIDPCVSNVLKIRVKVIPASLITYLSISINNHFLLYEAVRFSCILGGLVLNQPKNGVSEIQDCATNRERQTKEFQFIDLTMIPIE
jgi:hypothetical protein